MTPPLHKTFWGRLPLYPKLIEMTSLPPPPLKKERREREREKGQRKKWKMTNWVCYFFLLKRSIWYAFMLFLHFSRVGHDSLGKAELSECQKRFSFGILLSCLHYHIIANAVTTKFEGIFWWSPFKFNIFPFDPPLFFMPPPSTPQIPPAPRPLLPQSNNKWTVP